jgi:hypothetical protein
MSAETATEQEQRLMVADMWASRKLAVPAALRTAIVRYQVEPLDVITLTRCDLLRTERHELFTVIADELMAQKERRYLKN